MTSHLLRWINRPLPRSHLVTGLNRMTLAYLGLPVVLWVWGWLAWPWATLLSVCIIAACVGGIRPIGRVQEEWRRRQELSAQFPLWVVLVIVAIGCLWSLYSGAGGFVYQNPDWDKHSAVLKDLIEAPWPVAYRLEAGDIPLVYYLAYYLPAALVGKFAGWWWANVALLVWTALGVCLALHWFVLLVQKRPLLSALIFVFANGLDFLGQRIVSGTPLPPSAEHIDWWAGWLFLSFPGHLSQLAWAPQHSIAAWLVIGSMAVQLPQQDGLNRLGLPGALAAFWSPFTVVGLAPFFLLAVIFKRGRGALHWMNLTAVPILLAAILYYGSSTASPPRAWLWDAVNLREDGIRFILFHLLEWGIFYFFARELRSAGDRWLRLLFWCLPVVLVASSLYRFGIFNDSCMRFPIPALFLLWGGVARSMNAHPGQLESRILALLLVFGAMGSLPELLRAWRMPSLNIEDESVRVHVPQLDGGISEQYLGSKESFFFRHLARNSEGIPISSTPTAP